MTSLLSTAPILDLRSGQSNLDWPTAIYEAEASGGSGNWRIEHRLEGARAIYDLIEAGNAAWAAEVRCPRTLYSHLSWSSTNVTTVQFDDSKTREPVFVVPGIIALDDCYLSTVETATIWQRAGSSVPVRRGTWLVRGRAQKADVMSSLLLFIEDDALDDHELRIGPYTDQDGNTRLRISMSSKQLPHTRDEAFVAQAWQAAMAYLPKCDAFLIGETGEPESVYGQELVAKLGNLPLWNDPAWDPLRAATSLLRMPLPAIVEHREE